MRNYFMREAVVPAEENDCPQNIKLFPGTLFKRSCGYKGKMLSQHFQASSTIGQFLRYQHQQDCLLVGELEGVNQSR